MKLAAVARPFDEDNIRLLVQLGVPDLVYYDMHGLPDADALEALQRQVGRLGARIVAVEGGPPIDRIVLGAEGRDAQIEGYREALAGMARAGIRTLCYNFMPQVTDDAMVVRTSYRTVERGGALTSGFRTPDLATTPAPVTGDTTDEQMWEHLAYFLRAIVPVAETVGIRLALHPDDPPLSPIWGFARILRSVESFDRLFALAPSPVNGLTFCQGCFAEMGVPLPEAIRHFGSRIHFVHCRDVAGTPDDFHETFPDNGPTDMVAVFAAYRDIGYDGWIRSDHVPRLVTEPGAHDGYGMQGNIFAIGYLKGLMEPLFGKPTAARLVS